MWTSGLALALVSRHPASDAELIAYERKMVDGLQGAETKISETFAKVDSEQNTVHLLHTCTQTRIIGLFTCWCIVVSHAIVVPDASCSAHSK